jgi:hypothetical protein
MDTHRPLTLSIKELSQAVEKAVQRVAAQHHIEFTPELKIYPGLIIGRQLRRNNLTCQQAEQIATEITEQLAQPPAHPGAAVAVSALSPDPMVISLRRTIIVSNWEGQNPRL